MRKQNVRVLEYFDDMSGIWIRNQVKEQGKMGGHKVEERAWLGSCFEVVMVSGTHAQGGSR